MKTELKSVIAVPAWPVSSNKSPNIIPNDEVGPNVVIYKKKKKINLPNIFSFRNKSKGRVYNTSYVR